MTMMIHIKTQNGDTLTLEVDENDTVVSIKWKVRAKKCFAPEDQRLCLEEGGILDNTCTLRSYNIVNDSVLNLNVSVTLATAILMVQDGDEDRVRKYIAGWSEFIGSILLHIAIEYGHGGITQLLIDHGFDVNARDAGQRTPLICASDYGCTGIVEVLLAKGANVNDVNDYRWTSLDFATSNGHTSIEDMLTAAGGKGGHELKTRKDEDPYPTMAHYSDTDDGND